MSQLQVQSLVFQSQESIFKTMAELLILPIANSLAKVVRTVLEHRDEIQQLYRDELAVVDYQCSTARTVAVDVQLEGAMLVIQEASESSPSLSCFRTIPFRELMMATNIGERLRILCYCAALLLDCVGSHCFGLSGGFQAREYLEIIFKPHPTMIGKFLGVLSSGSSAVMRLMGSGSESPTVDGETLNIAPGSGKASYLLLTWVRTAENSYTISFVSSNATFRFAQASMFSRAKSKSTFSDKERRSIEADLKRQAVCTFISENESALEELSSPHAADLKRVAELDLD